MTEANHITHLDGTVSCTYTPDAVSVPRHDSLSQGLQDASKPSPILSAMSSTATFCTQSSAFKDEKLAGYTQTLPIPAIATKAQLEALEIPLPGKPRSWLVQNLRWRFFSMYRKIFTIVYILNIVPAIVVLYQLRYSGSSIPTYEHASTAAAANLCAGVLMRNEHVVNFFFRMAGSIPRSAPLWIRRQAAKVYSYGGIHSATATSATTWYFAFCGLLIYDFCQSGSIQIGLAVTSAMVFFLLIIILAFAYPTIRMRHHDAFEKIHRFCGWTAVACFWVQTGLVAATQSGKQSIGRVLVQIPTFWFLIVITCCIVYPWTRLRSREVKVEVLSKHAVRLHFDYQDIESCVGVRLTDAPLVETHSFATIPNRADQGKGFSILVSNAGDWTDKMIRNPPNKIWVKGAPTMGVIRVSMLFKKVLVIATGSGIGPCLSFLQAHSDFPVRVLWTAPNPLENWGREIFESVYRADPEAVVVDTKKTDDRDDHLIGIVE